MEFRQSRRVIQNSPTQRQTTTSQGGAVRSLRRPRSVELIAAVHRLDASVDQSTRQQIAQWIRDECANDAGELLVGFVSQCGLGPPYVDHILDLGGAIVNHYASADPMPEPYANARMLARSNQYAFVEVYLSGLVVPVLANGDVVL